MHAAMQKLLKKRKVLKKINEQVSKRIKQWILRCPPEKREMNKIAHVFFTKCSSIFKRDMFSRCSIRIRISHHIHLSFIHHIPYTCTS
jgi:tRNA C32,U32 (ribose-2'-O)-methylase TrmJ